jgi:hypothetical protein
MCDVRNITNIKGFMSYRHETTFRIKAAASQIRKCYLHHLFLIQRI